MLCAPDKCVVESCCCGIWSLKTGCISIGFTDVVIGVISAVQNLYGLIANLNNSEVIVAALLDLLLAIVIIILGVMLIQGVRKERPSYLKTWIYVTFVLVALELIFAIAGFLLGYNWLNMLPNFIVLGICIYFLIVVRSYFLMLQGDLVPTSA